MNELDDWDRRNVLQQMQSSSSTTTHQPQSITMASTTDPDDFIGEIPGYESYLAEELKTQDVKGDIDDWDHRVVQDPPQYSADHSESTESDIDDYDHRPPVPATPPIKSHSPNLKLQRGDVDDYDHRILDTQASDEGEATVEEEQGDIDDFDHRSLQNPPPPIVEGKEKKTSLLGVDDLIHDSRSKWALGNLTKKDIEEQREASAEYEAEKQARKKKEAELQRHAWGG